MIGGADPGRFYDLAAYHQALRDLLGMDLGGQNWSYPPSVMLLAAPFGQLNYLAALGCWTGESRYRCDLLIAGLDRFHHQGPAR
jgi:hypothetical protein